MATFHKIIIFQKLASQQTLVCREYPHIEVPNVPDGLPFNVSIDFPKWDFRQSILLLGCKVCVQPTDDLGLPAIAIEHVYQIGIERPFSTQSDKGPSARNPLLLGIREIFV